MSPVPFHILFTCRNSLLYYKKQNKSAFHVCKPGRRSSVFEAVFSCLEMGPTEQRQYFTVGWQAAAKVFTALLQCGKMDPGRQAQLEAWENDRIHHVLFRLTIHTAYIISLCVCYIWLCRTMSDRRPCTHLNIEQFLWMDAVSPF